MALADTAQKANNRRLTVYQDKITCKPGCSGCCNRLISITLAEAIVIHDYLLSHNQWKETRTRCERIAGMSLSSDPLSWFKMNIKCPVLNPETDECGAYPIRPSLCSTHFVTSDPRGCDPWSAADTGFEPVDMADLHQDFVKRLMEVVDEHGMMQITAPIPIALLLAERVQIKTGLDLQQVISFLFNELK